MAPKKKTEKMSLGTFLQDDSYGSWADEMEDQPLPSNDARPSYGSERRPYASNMGGGNGFSDRRDTYPSREQLPLPTQPPYTAHLANLSFDATQGDIEEFFRNCEVTSVRIVEDKLDRKPKGFGYVEFASLDGLKAALALSSSSLQGRSIRVSVAEPPKDRQESRDFSDWSRKGPLPDLPGAQRRVSDRNFGNRNFDNTSDAGSERGGRRGYEPSDGKTRDFSNWERRGPLPPTAAPAQSLRDGGRQMSKDGPPSFRRSSPAWGEGRSQDGSRPPRREYVEKPPVERQATASELDNEWRARMKPTPPAKSPTPDTSNPPSPHPEKATPATRPKLNLQKRTVSEADPATSPALGGESKASPFGAARPVDTAAKERELDEKRKLAIRKKKEADDKAKSERAEEKRLAAEKADVEKVSTLTSPRSGREGAQVEEDEEAPSEPQPGPKFDILRRVDSSTNDMVAEEENDEEDEVQLPSDDKNVKPKDIVVNSPAGQTNGSWRNSGPKQAGTIAEGLEEEGWSTVSKPTKQRNNRRNNVPTRAVAS